MLTRRKGSPVSAPAEVWSGGSDDPHTTQPLDHPRLVPCAQAAIAILFADVMQRLLLKGAVDFAVRMELPMHPSAMPTPQILPLGRKDVVRPLASSLSSLSSAAGTFPQPEAQRAYDHTDPTTDRYTSLTRRDLTHVQAMRCLRTRPDLPINTDRDWWCCYDCCLPT